MLDGRHADEEKDQNEHERPAGDGAGKDDGGGIHVPAIWAPAMLLHVRV